MTSDPSYLVGRADLKSPLDVVADCWTRRGPRFIALGSEIPTTLQRTQSPPAAIIVVTSAAHVQAMVEITPSASGGATAVGYAILGARPFARSTLEFLRSC